MKQKRIIILATPRSGTGYAAKYYQAHGFKVFHESMGKEGTSDWTLIKDYERSPNDFVIHLVRNPLNVISSMVYTLSYNAITLMKERLKIPNTHMIRLIASCYIGWNQLIKSIEPDVRIQVENMSEEITFLNKPKFDLPSDDYNSRHHPGITWEDLEKSLTSEDFIKLKELNRWYGYD